MFGKTVSELQDITVENDELSGTLYYVTGYTGFSDTTTEQEGNYLALHISASGSHVAIAVELVGSDNGEVTLDDDGIVILRVTSNTQSVRVTASQANTTIAKVYALDSVTLAT